MERPVIATARTIAEARIKERAAKVLFGNNYLMWASGLWCDEEGEYVFLEAHPALIEKLGRKWAVVDTDYDLIKAQPDPHSDYAEIQFSLYPRTSC